MSEEVKLPEVGSEWLYRGTHSEPQLVKVLGVRTIIEWFYVDSHLKPAKVYQADAKAWGESFKPTPFKLEVGKTYKTGEEYKFYVYEVLDGTVYGREHWTGTPGDWYSQSYNVDYFEGMVKNGKA